MSKILVIGSNSFSGQDFIDLLLDETSHTVLGTSRSPENSTLFLKYRERKDLSRFSYFQADLNKNMESLLDRIDSEAPDYIVNFAAQSEVGPSWQRPGDWYQTNCVSLAKLINHLKDSSTLKKYVHISSPEIYGDCVGTITEDSPANPSTPYAGSKFAADELLRIYHQQFKFPVSWVRATNVYGARQQLFKIIPRSIIYIRKGKTIELHGGGTAVKSYINIRDISHGELKIMESGDLGQIYHLSPKGGVSIKDLVGGICERMGVDTASATKTVDERPGQDAAYVIDSTKARQELDWSPIVSLEDGIQEVVDWVDAYWDDIKDQELAYLHKP
jgi:dTDP-glucose 4,6-dehydratase